MVWPSITWVLIRASLASTPSRVTREHLEHVVVVAEGEVDEPSIVACGRGTDFLRAGHPVVEVLDALANIGQTGLDVTQAVFQSFGLEAGLFPVGIVIGVTEGPGNRSGSGPPMPTRVFGLARLHDQHKLVGAARGHHRHIGVCSRRLRLDEQVVGSGFNLRSQFVTNGHILDGFTLGKLDVGGNPEEVAIRTTSGWVVVHHRTRESATPTVG